jgi:hypothetical protein
MAAAQGCNTGAACTQPHRSALRRFCTNRTNLALSCKQLLHQVLLPDLAYELFVCQVLQLLHFYLLALHKLLRKGHLQAKTTQQK